MYIKLILNQSLKVYFSALKNNISLLVVLEFSLR
jgi:hypothetical protein